MTLDGPAPGSRIRRPHPRAAVMAEPLTLTEAEWTLADRIACVLEADRDRLWTVSALARKVHATHGQIWPVLRWMEAEVFLVGEGNGAWRKYRARRVGEYGPKGNP